MANIYQISQDLLDIFSEIEDNDGELTPELEEKLNVTQDDFKSKLKSYAEIVKNLQTDISAIKEEKKRLSDLQASKERTIERLQSVMATAISTFGDTTKTGGKFVDYGTGKISVRNSDTIEVNEDLINRFVNRYVSGLKWYSMQGQLDESIISAEDLCNYANSVTQEEEDNGETFANIVLDELCNVKADISVDIPLNSLLDTEEGFNLAKALVKFGGFNIKAKADKAAIKKEAKEEHTMPVFAKLVNKQSVIIK